MTKKLTGNYKQYMDKSWLGEWDLPERGDMVLTIDHAEVGEVQNDRGTEKKMVLYFREDVKPMICNMTNGTAIAAALGTEMVERWEGKKISLYRDSVRAFGKTTKAIRVRDYAPVADEYICEECGTVIVDTGQYKAKSIAISSRNQFGRVLCMDCAKAAKEASK